MKMLLGFAGAVIVCFLTEPWVFFQLSSKKSIKVVPSAASGYIIPVYSSRVLR
jgi:hypothetical protein